AHALGGFVQQQQFRVERQGGGDFQGPLAAIGQFDAGGVGEIDQSDVVEQGHGALVERVENLVRTPEVVGQAEVALQGHAHVVEYGQVRKHRGDLERAHDAQVGDVRGLAVGDGFALVDDRA